MASLTSTLSIIWTLTSSNPLCPCSENIYSSAGNPHCPLTYLLTSPLWLLNPFRNEVIVLPMYFVFKFSPLLNKPILQNHNERSDLYKTCFPCPQPDLPRLQEYKSGDVSYPIFSYPDSCFPTFCPPPYQLIIQFLGLLYVIRGFSRKIYDVMRSLQNRP